ncbi:MAG: CopG family transcriptional regulator [Quinella sp. 3Q1]|nr:CopG family transcriptional regulator [Quinella sp. 3Q1]
MATISFEFSDKAYDVLEELASRKDIGVSEFARRALLEKMEDEEDLKAVAEALREDEGDPTTYKFKELKDKWLTA